MSVEDPAPVEEMAVPAPGEGVDVPTTSEESETPTMENPSAKDPCSIIYLFVIGHLRISNSC